MSQTPNRAVVRLLGDKESVVDTSVEDGERVATHLLYGGNAQAIEVKRLHNGARVVTRTAAIACVEFVQVEESRTTDPSGWATVRR